MGRSKRPSPGQSRPERPSAHSLLNTSRPTSAPSPADANNTQPFNVAEVRRRLAIEELRRARDQHLPPALEQHQPVRRHEHRGVLSTWVFLALGAILALALVIGASWWLITPEGGVGSEPPSPPAPTTTSSGAGKTQTLDDLAERLPKLPGVHNRHNGVHDVAEGARSNLYSDGEAKVLTEEGVRKVVWLGSAEDDIAYAVLVAESKNPAAARRTTKSLLAKTTAGLDEADIAGHQTLSSFRRVDSSSKIYFTVYTSGKYTVRAAIAQIPAGDAKDLAGRLSGMLSQLRKELPPD